MSWEAVAAEVLDVTSWEVRSQGPSDTRGAGGSSAPDSHPPEAAPMAEPADVNTPGFVPSGRLPRGGGFQGGASGDDLAAELDVIDRLADSTQQQQEEASGRGAGAAPGALSAAAAAAVGAGPQQGHPSSQPLPFQQRQQQPLPAASPGSGPPTGTKPAPISPAKLFTSRSSASASPPSHLVSPARSQGSKRGGDSSSGLGTPQPESPSQQEPQTPERRPVTADLVRRVQLRRARGRGLPPRRLRRAAPAEAAVQAELHGGMPQQSAAPVASGGDIAAAVQDLTAPGKHGAAAADVGPAASEADMRGRGGGIGRVAMAEEVAPPTQPDMEGAPSGDSSPSRQQEAEHSRERSSEGGIRAHTRATLRGIGASSEGGAVPGARLMTQAELREVAAKHGLSFEELLAAAEARGIQLPE